MKISGKTAYAHIVEDLLRIGGKDSDRRKFFASHLSAICAKLLHAGHMMRQSVSSGNADHAVECGSNLYVNRHDLFGINQCLHLANVVQLLGTDSRRLNRTISIISSTPEFKDRDPTTVIPSAVLYYLINAAEKECPLLNDGLTDSSDERCGGLVDQTIKHCSILTKEFYKKTGEDHKTGEDDSSLLADLKVTLEYIRHRFSSLNWMLDSACAGALFE